MKPMGNLISAADVFVDREILRFAEDEPVSDLEGEIIAGFLNVKSPPIFKIADLLGEGKYGEVGDLMAEVWAVQFRRAITDAITTQLQLAGHAAARKLGDDGFGVEEMIAVAAEHGAHLVLPRGTVFTAYPGEKVSIAPPSGPKPAPMTVHIDLRESGIESYQFAAPALTAPTFNPTDPRVAVWLEGRIGAILGALEGDARAIVTEAITRGAAGELTERQVARVIAQHVGLDSRRAIAVENYRKFLYEFRGRTDMERLIKRRPKYIRERLQRGGFKRKEWRLIREQGAKKALKDRRLEVMTKDYAERLRKERALDISRTEIVMAKNRGKEIAWKQAQENGALLPGAKRKWITRRDNKVCSHCRQMHGKLAPIDGMWQTPVGSVSTPNEIHTKCRCDEVLIAAPAKPRSKKPKSKPPLPKIGKAVSKKQEFIDAAKAKLDKLRLVEVLPDGRKLVSHGIPKTRFTISTEGAGRPSWKDVPISKLRIREQGEVVKEIVSVHVDATFKSTAAIDVVQIGDEFVIWDGHHRAVADMLAGKKTISAKVWQGKTG